MNLAKNLIEGLIVVPTILIIGIIILSSLMSACPNNSLTNNITSNIITVLELSTLLIGVPFSAILYFLYKN